MAGRPEGRLCVYLILGSLIGLSACASKVPEEPPVEDELLLQELMEYLLEFEDEEGEWVDPQQVQD
jgi:hypothetical protein